VQKKKNLHCSYQKVVILNPMKKNKAKNFFFLHSSVCFEREPCSFFTSGAAKILWFMAFRVSLLRAGMKVALFRGLIDA